MRCKMFSPLQPFDNSTTVRIFIVLNSMNSSLAIFAMTKLILLIRISASEIFEWKKKTEIGKRKRARERGKKTNTFIELSAQLGEKVSRGIFQAIIDATDAAAATTIIIITANKYVMRSICVLQICDPFSMWFAIQSRFDQCEKCVCVFLAWTLWLLFNFATLTQHTYIRIYSSYCAQFEMHQILWAWKTPSIRHHSVRMSFPWIIIINRANYRESRTSECRE